jgi:FkbM family methyltransferase
MLSAAKQMLRQKLVKRLGVPEIPPALERLQRNGYAPAHIFDVGAHAGEFSRAARAVWPSARITCFEVLPHRVTETRAWCKADGNAELFAVLLGPERRDAVPFHELESASSVLEEHIPKGIPVRPHPMRAIDDLAADGIGPPDFLKLDVQGFELEILKGAAQSLPRISAILAETNLIDIHRGAALLDDLVLFLRDRGFVAYDICGLTRRPLDEALWTADFIFVRADGALRSNKAWR